MNLEEKRNETWKPPGVYSVNRDNNSNIASLLVFTRHGIPVFQLLEANEWQA